MKIRLRKLPRKYLIILFTLPAVIIFGTFISTYINVSKSCKNVKNKYGTDCVDGMIKTLESVNTSAEEKNHAIWVLGKLADKKASPTLRSLYARSLSKYGALDKKINERKLVKAMNRCSKDNYTNWMYERVK